MLTTSKKQNKPSLIGATTLQEAITVLTARRAPRIYTAAVSNIFKADMKNPASKTWIEQQLRETESTLKKDEDEKEVEDKKLMGYQQNLKETEGNPPSGPNPKPESIADKTGVTAQNDGTSLEDIHDSNPPATQGSEGAHTQQGESQLKEAIDKVFSVGLGVDPLNQSVINGMSNGMSKVEAENAANADNHMMEAVFHKMTARTLVPIFKAQNNLIHNLNETIRVYDQKLEAARKENKGLNEAIQITPSQTVIPVPYQNGPQQENLPPKSIKAHREEISQKLKSNTIYN